jgi:hypothetical protein
LSIRDKPRYLRETFCDECQVAMVAVFSVKIGSCESGCCSTSEVLLQCPKCKKCEQKVG